MAEIQLHFDSKIDIATGISAQTKRWCNRSLNWSAFVNMLSQPIVTKETYRQFMEASKAIQGQIKDVGGYVGGRLKNGKRGKNDVEYRSIITLDIDFSYAEFWWDFTLMFSNAAVIHSTHKSGPKNYRHRLIMPLSRTVTPEEYQAVSRYIAGCMNISLFDQTTFDVNRLMFWPSISADQEYFFQYQDGPFLDVDRILNSYDDWHNVEEWPRADTEDKIVRDVKKQEDPLSKNGVIGAFCRSYSIQDAIETFLPEEYVRVDDNRYTYLHGTTAGGLVIFEDKFAYSFHSTDPACGKLCNAFDLVRIHKFGGRDTEENLDDDKNSTKALEEFALKDPVIRKQLAVERYESARSEFSGSDYEPEPAEDDDMSWTSELECDKKGTPKSSAGNLNTILRNDRVLKDLFATNEFDRKPYIMHSAPWRNITRPEPVRDVDFAGVRNYIECFYEISSSSKIDDAVKLRMERNKFHPVRDYISKQQWDGKKRIDTLLIDYFGADDNAYTRASIRKMLTAAVARVFEPGIKFDTALILVGPQGTYKSTFIRKLGMRWFSDTFTTVQGKESFEQIQGRWLIEMAELSGLKKAEVESIKHYISKCSDTFRPAYARTTENFERQCVFFGTTNSKDFLRDPTGNRRFLPIDVHTERAARSVADDLAQDEVDQIWAEAYQLYKSGEPLYLSREENLMAAAEQEKHSETDERKGVIEEFLNKPYPADWKKMDIYERKRWLDDPLAKKGTMERYVVCAAEVWCECFGRDKADMTRYNTKEINDILKSLKDWEYVNSTMNFPLYGKQRYYRRKDSLM